MRTVVLLVIALCTFAACKKKDTPDAYKVILPKPTCNDNNDDGRYETWDTTIVFFNWAHNKPEYTSVIDTYYVTTQTLDSATNSLQLVARTHVPARLGAFIVRDSTTTQTWGDPLALSNQHTLNLNDLASYPKGCYRLFYHLKDEEGSMITKGHYDISVNNP